MLGEPIKAYGEESRRGRRNRVSHIVYQVLEEQSQPSCLSGIRGIESAILLRKNLYGGGGVFNIFSFQGGSSAPIGALFILFIRYSRNTISHLVNQVFEEQSQPSCLSGIRGIESAVLFIRYQRNRVSHLIQKVLGQSSQPIFFRYYQDNLVSHLVYQILDQYSQPSSIESIGRIQSGIRGIQSQPSCLSGIRELQSAIFFRKIWKIQSAILFIRYQRNTVSHLVCYIISQSVISYIFSDKNVQDEQGRKGVRVQFYLQGRRNRGIAQLDARSEFLFF